MQRVVMERRVTQSRASRRAGFVLTGGASRRMGVDKALLPWKGRTMVEAVAEAVRTAAGNVTLVGAPERYAHLGLPTIADEKPSLGPLGGLVSALRNSHAEWNLLTACDMPELDARILRQLFERAEAGIALSVAARTSRGLEPLCAVYHRTVLPLAEREVLLNKLKMQDFLARLDADSVAVDDQLLRNVNAPDDLLEAVSTAEVVPA